MALDIVDLYCGAGGFSEGFRQMGFNVIAGFDIWNEARATFKKNHPSAFVPDKFVDISRFRRNIIDILKEKSKHIDVIIGGPPCIEFSSSKNGGDGDIKKGLRQVDAFFEIVAELDPDYWIMENVPRIEQHLESAIEDGDIVPPSKRKKWIFNASYHDTPQARRRMFTGNFPGEMVINWEEKRKEAKKRLGMEIVVNDLPDCFSKPNGNIISDPLYHQLRINDQTLSDHFGLGDYLSLNNIEQQMNIDLKQHHPYYGKMNFPERVDLPSRTIMASQFPVSRESIIIRDKRRKILRRLTPRECASLQGYPISYQFWGNSLASKYKLIGNSVPVGLSRDLAKSILLGNDMDLPSELDIKSGQIEKPLAISIPKKKKQTLHSTFRWHPIGSLSKGSRVDLDNTQKFSKKFDPNFKDNLLNHDCRWDAILHSSIGKPRWKHQPVDIDSVVESLKIAEIETVKKRRLLRMVKNLHGNIPDATSLLWAHQNPSMRNWRISTNGIARPRYIIDLIDEIRFNSIGKSNPLIDCRKYIKISPKKGLPLKVIITAFILYWACKEINECTCWMQRNEKKRYQLASHNSRKESQEEDLCNGVLSDSYPEAF